MGMEHVKYVVLGDVGLHDLYHVGDEAMMDVAIEMLTSAPGAQITLVAGDPDTAASVYGLPAVKRIGFSPHWIRARSDARLEAETAPAKLDDSAPGSLPDVVREADAVLIAGGGNMTSRFAHHLYERVALTRMARHFGKPLFVTSQTVGPVMRAQDEALLAELVRYASMFGARDDESHELLRRLAAREGAGSIHRTADDGVLLRGLGEAPASDVVLPERYVVASFTSDQGTTGLPPEQYIAAVAGLVDGLARELDVDVVLVPHTGSPGAAHAGDEVTDEAIVRSSTSGRVRALPVRHARATAAITAGAILSVSSRYHAAVFASSAGIPTVAVSLSHYSSVRFRGALAPVGLEAYIVPATAWEQILPACVDAVRRRAEPTDAHMHAADAQRSFQRAWWSAITSAAMGSAYAVPAFPRAQQIAIDVPWANEVRRAFEFFDVQGPERMRVEWLERDVELLTKHARDVSVTAESQRRELQALRSRKLTRLAVRLSALRRRFRRRFSSQSDASRAEA